MEDVISHYVAELLKKAGIDTLPGDFRKEYVEKLTAEVQQRLGIMALSELDEAGVTAFETMSNQEKTPSPRELLEFFNSHIPDFQKKVEASLEQFSQEFLKGATQLKQVKLNQ